MNKKKRRTCWGKVRVTAQDGVKWHIRMTKSNLMMRRFHGRKNSVLFLPLVDCIEIAAGQRLLRL